MLKILPIIPSSTSQKNYPFYSQIITYYSYIILLPYCFKWLHSGKQGANIHFVVGI